VWGKGKAPPPGLPIVAIVYKVRALGSALPDHQQGWASLYGRAQVESIVERPLVPCALPLKRPLRFELSEVCMNTRTCAQHA